MIELRLRVGEPLAFGQVRARPAHLAAFSSRMAADGALRFEPGVVDSLVTARSVEALSRAIRIADELGMRCWLEVTTASELDVMAEDASPVLHERTTPAGRLVLRAGEGTVTEHVELMGRTLSTTVLSAHSVRRAEAATPALGSPRLTDFARAERMMRGPVLEAFDGLPAWPVLLRFEASAGGWIAPWSRDPIARPALLFGLEVCRIACQDGLKDDWCFTHEEDFEEGTSLLEVNEWPRCRYRGVDLVFVGEIAHSHSLLLDEEGALWRYFSEFAAMELVSGNPTTLLELMALDASLWTRPAHAKTTVATDVGNRVARALHLSLDPVASDPIVQCYDDTELWLRQTAARGPIEAKLEIIGDDPERVALAVRTARVLAPQAAVSVQESRPGGRERAALLRAQGLL